MADGASRPEPGVSYRWRGPVDDHEVGELTASCGGEPEQGWWDRVRPHSLGWVTARAGDGSLAGFVNVAWDGCRHAFLLDTMTRGPLQRRGIGTTLVAMAVDGARAAGCAWLHVDFAPGLGPFYVGACGFTSTAAGLLRLPAPGASEPS